MIRLLLFFVALAFIAYGGMWLVQHPGHVSMNWFGYQIETSAVMAVIAVSVAAIVAWIILRVIVGLPSFVRLAARQRRREKGYQALSRGLVAVGAGDTREAVRASDKANRHLKDDALALMLQAQAAHLSGNDASAVRAFQALAKREDTRVVGLRGLYHEACRRGDDVAARHFAAAAHRAAPLPWSAQAVLEHRASDSQWEEALVTVESSVAAGLVDKPTGERQRAVLETAIAYDREGTAPDEALSIARAAMKRAPDLAPPIVLATRLLSRRGDIRKAVKLVEKAWPRCQHPDIAQAYLDVRPGDSTTDRLARAKTLMGISSVDPVSRMTVARAAVANKDYATARGAMAPLVGEGTHPTARMCQLMAEIEEAEFGDVGQWREWLGRASRAALDPAWIADGIVYEDWGPVSPTTGKLDAFRWQVPAERLGPAMEALPARRSREAALGSVAAARLGHDARPLPTEPDVGAPAAAEMAVTSPDDRETVAPAAITTAVVAPFVPAVPAPPASPPIAATPAVLLEPDEYAAPEPTLVLDSDASPEVDKAAHELEEEHARAAAGRPASSSDAAPPPIRDKRRRRATYTWR